MGTRVFIVAALLCTVIVSPMSQPAVAAVPPPAIYSVADLGAPAGSVPFAINDAGTVVGSMRDGNGFRSQDHVVSNLGPGGALALSERGAVFGGGHGTGAGGSAYAVTINGAVAAGGTRHPGVIPSAYGTGITVPGTWSAATGWNDLYDRGCRFPTMIMGVALGITPGGTLVGQAVLDSDGIDGPGGVSGVAFACTPDPSRLGQYVISNLAPASPSPYNGAFAINGRGTIVGKANNEATLWESPDPNSYRPLGEYADGHEPPTGITSQSVAYGINDRDAIVGAYGPVVTNKFLDVGDFRQRAFIWTESRGMRDLNDLIPPDSGWTLHGAYDINNSGQIVGWGTTGGEQRAFLLTPGGDVNITADAIMVTQAIQNDGNLDLLVADKPTHAIVRTHSDTRDVAGVTAVLSAYRNGQLLGTLNPVGPPVSVRAVPLGDRVNHSFVFALDPSWTGEGSLTLEATVNPAFDIEELDYGDNTEDTSVTFSPSPQLSIVVVDAYYEGEPAPSATASAASYSALVGNMRRMMPTGHLLLAHHPAAVAIPFRLNPADQCGATIAELQRVRLNLGLDSRTMLYGQMGPRADGNPPYSYRDANNVLHNERLAGCSYVPDMVATGFFEHAIPGLGEHELIHALGRNHVPYCNAVGSDNPAYPDPNAEGRIYAGSLHRNRLPAGTLDYGFDGSRILPWSSGQDIMTYCDLWWPSDYTYEHVYSLISQVGTRPTNTLSSAAAIVGQIDDLTGTAEFSVTAYEPEAPVPAPTPGPFHLEFYAGTTKLADVPFTPSVEGPHDSAGGEPPRALINEIVALPDGTDRIAVFDDRAGREIGSTAVSGVAPTVAWSSPQAGDQLPAAGPLTLAWSSQDGDGDSLTHTVLYRPGAGRPWTVVANGVTGTSTTVDAAVLDGSTDGTLRVIAHDGIHAARADLAGLRVPAKPPVIDLAAPAGGTVITTEQALELSATAQSLAGDALDASAFVWTSDLDGTLGTGPLVVVDALSVGTHQIELEVTGPDGASATATTTVVVTAPGEAPGRLALSYDRLSFTGDALSPAPAPQSIEVYDERGGAIDWTASADDPRVAVSPTSGSTPTELAVSVDTGELHAGEALDAVVTVRRSDGSEDPLTIDVHAASSGATGVVAPATLNFGRQALGSAGPPEDITFTYRGHGSMTLGTVALAGPAPDEYTLASDGCSNATLAAGDACTVAVSYAPTAAGRHPAYLVVPDSDSETRWFASLTGLAARSFTSSVVAWGNNDNGQLGSAPAGTCVESADFLEHPCSPVPITVPGLSDVVQVASGGSMLDYGGYSGSHSLALKSDGTVWAWGSNKGGELGNGTWDGAVCGCHYVAMPHPTPAQVLGLSDVTAIAAGQHFSMALRGDGTVWTWGLGALGNGTSNLSTTPVQVKGPNGVGFLTGVVAIAAGDDGTNLYAFALKADGTVWGWGYNDGGQVGNGTQIPNYVLTPTQVVGPGGQGFLTDVVAIASRTALRSDGTVWSWGPQGGLGTYIGRTNTLTPVQVTTGLTEPPLTGIAAIASDGTERFALGQDGRVWAWGQGPTTNPWLDLGLLNTGFLPLFAQPVVAPGGLGQFSGVTMLSPGAAITGDGALWGWGNNTLGQAGVGVTTTQAAPRRVVGVGGTGFLDDVVQLSGGIDHRLAIVGTAGGSPTTLSVGTPAALTAESGETFEAAIGSFDDDLASRAFDFSASVDWGDSTSDAAVTVTGPDGGPYEVRGTHTYTTPGSFHLTIDVLGRNGDSITLDGSVTVAPATLVGLPGDEVVFTAGTPGQHALGAVDSSNPASTASSFTATVDWGDGAAVAAATVAGPPGGPFSVVGEHTYGRAGSYPLTLHVLGDGGAAVTVTATAVVVPAALTPRDTFGSDVEAGTAFSGSVASFDDGNPLAILSDYSALVDWGDGTTTAGTVSGPTGGPWTVGGDHTYATAQPFTVGVTINGPAGASASATTTLLSHRPHIGLTATAAPSNGATPLETTFSYVVDNDGSDRLVVVDVNSALCGSAPYASGDDGNGALDPGESWTFTCTHTFTASGSFTDVGWATAYALADGVPVRSDNTSTVVNAGDTTPPVVTVTGVTDGATYVPGAVPVAGCSTVDPEPSSGLATEAAPVTAGGPTEYTVTCSGAVDEAGNIGNTAVARYTVRSGVYEFSGFKPPVDNRPTVNRVRAGAAVPVKFSLGGDHGLEIFASGFPRSQQVACGSSADVDGIEQTVSAGESSLGYDPGSDTYIYIWKTDARWRNTCRQLVLTFTDGSTARADFTFTR